MNRLLAFVVLALLSGCTPSMSYMNGQGFYSPKYTKTQVMGLAAQNQVENLGHFSVTKGGCFLFSRDTADERIVIPAVQDALKKAGGNAADSIATSERWYDFFLGILILPGFAGCSNWTIAGDAMLVGDEAIGFGPAQNIQGATK
jgi:hypothetical protein